MRVAQTFLRAGVKRLILKEPVVPKAARIFSSISPRIFTESSAVPAKRSDTSELIGVVLFAGIGLFFSLVTVILGIQGAWF